MAGNLRRDTKFRLPRDFTYRNDPTKDRENIGIGIGTTFTFRPGGFLNPSRDRDVRPKLRPTPRLGPQPLDRPNDVAVTGGRLTRRLAPR